MEALVTAFVAAFLCGWGDKTQLIAALLTARTGRPGIILLGLFAAALASHTVAAAAGVMVAGSIPPAAMSLMVALALLFGGIAGFVPRAEPSLGSMKLPLILVVFLLCLGAEVGDRAQFLTFALAGRFDSVALATAGATAGTFAACLPAILLGDQLKAALPLRALRYGVAALFLIAGFVVAVQALGLA